LVFSIKFKPSQQDLNLPESTMYPVTPDSTAIAQLHDQARREARRLRREAVTDFWRGAACLMARRFRSLRLSHSTPTTTQKA
jgi:hypothetical protein